MQSLQIKNRVLEKAQASFFKFSVLKSDSNDTEKWRQQMGEWTVNVPMTKKRK